MKKLIYLIVLAFILGLVLTGCTLLSNIGQAPATEQSGITYLTKGGVPPSVDLVGLWHFDEGVSTIASDSSGNGNTGILTNMDTATCWVLGKFGNALSFDGMNDCVEVPSDSSIMPATLTVEAWIQPGKTGARQSIVSKWDGMGDASYSLELTAGNKFLFYLHNGTKTQSITGTTVVAIGTWYHVAGTYDGSSANLYVDGNLEEGPTTLVAPMTNSNVPLRIGVSAAYPPLYPIHSPFKGKVDEVRIWKVALSQDQLGKVYEFDGFFPPINDFPMLNMVKAGRAIPVKFSLSGDQGLDIFEEGYPKSKPIQCGEEDPVGDITDEDTVTAGDSSLFYDTSTDQYIYVWKTDKSWADDTSPCRQLVVKLNDGKSYYANFKFK